MFRACTWSILLTLGALTSAQAADNPGTGVIEHFGLEQAATPVGERAGWRKVKRVLVGGWIPQLAQTLQGKTDGIEFVTATSPADAAAKAADGTSPPSDTNGSAEYRRHLATVLTRRALEAI